MTAYTHVAFASCMAIIFDYLDFKSILLFCLGSLVPDVDTRHSMVSKPLYPIWRLLDWIGVRHRTITHSFFLYMITLTVGAKLDIDWLFLGSMGAMTHIFIDCLNKSGVPIFLPISEKICVLTSRKYRIKSGSKVEVYFIATFIMIGYLFYNINSNGGSRAYLLKYLNNYQFTYNQYLATADRVSYLEAKVRNRSSQKVIDRRYLVICATNRNRELYLWDEVEERVVSTVDDINVLKGNLVATDKQWNHIYLGNIETLKSSSGLVFQRTNKSVRRVKVGEYMVKDIFYMESMEIE